MKKTAFILFVSFLLITSVSFGAVEKDSLKQDFSNATEAYTKGDYAAAKDLYEKVLAGGIESGNLYFNLGNSYYKLGNYGKARLNYEKAFQFIPRDSDLQYNYQFLMSFIREKRYDKENLLKRLFTDFIRDFSFGELELFLFALGTLFFIISALSLHLHWPSKANRFLIVIWCLFLIGAGGGIKIKLDEKNYAIVIKNTKAMFEPKKDSTTHFQLNEGLRVKVIKKENDWIKVKRADGKLGWVYQGDMESID